MEFKTSELATVLPHAWPASLRELAAYEILWKNHSNCSFESFLNQHPSLCQSSPPSIVSDGDHSAALDIVMVQIKQAGIERFGISIRNDELYPAGLRNMKAPPHLLYYLGNWDLTRDEKRIAIIGSRKASDEGIKRARKMSSMLVQEGFTILSGLADGIDTAAHTAAIASGGKTIAVIGTPITEYYPRQNKDLQKHIAERHLLVSQIPFWKYISQTYRENSRFFPQRNATMSAMSQGTVVIEAEEQSGTLTQAKAAIDQGRQLFILDSCFQRNDLTWPLKFLALGAIRVREVADIIEAIKSSN